MGNANDQKPPATRIIEKYTPIGRCIYCGAVADLSDEHIFPYSLQGQWVLPKASCKKCAEVTSAFEGRVCQMYDAFRQVNDIQSRRRKKRPGTITVKDNEGKDMLIPYDGVSAMYPTIKFKLPGYYRMPEWRPSKPSRGKGLPANRVDTILGIVPGPPRDVSLYNEYVAKGYSQMSSPFDLEAYELLMAKIAHCVCVGEYGVDNFEHLLPRFILGEKEVAFRYSLKRPPAPLDLSFFVGSFEEVPPALPCWNEFLVNTQESTTLKGFYALYVGIRLFALIGEPRALVVAGMVHESKYDKLIAYQKEKKGVLSHMSNVCKA